MGSMAPFWTRLPIQSCAPTMTSGPLPCWDAVTNVVCWSLEIALISTVTPVSFSNVDLKDLSPSARLSSAQITSFAPDGADGVLLGSSLPQPEPSNVRARDAGDTP